MFVFPAMRQLCKSLVCLACICPLQRVSVADAIAPTRERGRIDELLETLRKSFHVGLDQRLNEKVATVPEELKAKWVELAYQEINGKNNGMIKKYIELLDNIDLNLPRKRHTLRNFIYLKALVELIPDIEKKLNHRLELLKKS